MSSPDVTRTVADVAEDQRLLTAARDGDDGAFARMIERADPLLFELAAGMLDDEGIDEMLAECYVRCYRSVGRRHGDPLPWLLRTTYLACLAEARRRERRRAGGPGRLPDRRPTPDQLPLKGIASDERAVLILVDGASLPEDQVAAALDTEVATVRALLARARDKLDVQAELPEPAVTAHADDFWPKLGRQLIAEREAPALAVPEVLGPAGPGLVDQPVPDPPTAMQRRAPREVRSRSHEPDPVDGLALDAKRRRARSPLRAWLAKAVALGAVLAALGAVVLAVVDLGSKAKSPVRSNSVAAVTGQTIAALTVGTFDAGFTRLVVDPRGERRSTSYRLLRNDKGSFLLSTTDGTRVVSFDAPTNARRTRVGGADPSVPPAGTAEAGMAGGPPDPSPFDADLPDAEFDRALRILSTVNDEQAKSVTIKGVEAWQLEATVPDGGVAGADRVELVVDQARLAPMQVTYRLSGKVVRSITFADVVLDGPAPGPFTIDLTGVATIPADRGFRPVDISAVAAQVGYQPVRPTFLPAGFVLTATMVKPTDKIVSLSYQRGFQQIVISTRPSPVPKGASWRNPFRDAAVSRPRTVTIEEGRFRSIQAQRTGSIGSVPALWGTDGTLAFTIWGDLTEAEQLRVTGSLR